MGFISMGEEESDIGQEQVRSSWCRCARRACACCPRQHRLDSGLGTGKTSSGEQDHLRGWSSSAGSRSCRSSPAHHDRVLIRATGEQVSLAEGETVVGREEDLGVSLVGEGSVSRRHATIVRQGTSLTVKDLGSTNGTYVNGRRISADTPLVPGDDLQFGAVKFRVEAR